MEKLVLSVGKEYKFKKTDSAHEPIKGTYMKMERNGFGVRFAVFKKGKRTWWIPEKLWKYIKPVS